ncbi:MAG: hypothetical protein JO227_06195, partial [Acetobacteraceae bacterium]|nr:hypothetical protein [Acetobacteraceae bacterium]
LTGSAVGLVALDGTQSFVTADLQVPVPETAGITILGIALLGLTAVRVLHG